MTTTTKQCKSGAQRQSDGAPHASQGEYWPVVVVGAGIGGLCLAVKLREAGIEHFTLLERINDLGGTWARNTYPGAACDVPSTLYSYAFAPNPGWSRKYSTQPEILAYLRRTAGSYGITDKIRFNTEVTAAHFNETDKVWEVDTTQGSMTAGVLISAVGVFAEAAIPPIHGLTRFKGKKFHSLHWDHDYALEGKRVAIIGTGASAVQIIPELQRRVKNLQVYQRTPPWIVPRMDRSIGRLEQSLYRVLPASQRMTRGSWYAMIESFGLVGFVSTRFRYGFEALGRLQLRRQVKDKTLRRALTPNYIIGCKRAIFSDAYYPALCKANVEVVTDAIQEVAPHAIVTKNGNKRPVDVIILATGFSAKPCLDGKIIGTEGLSLTDVYHQQPRSYLGTSYTGFPNFFTLLGPFAAAANQSAIFTIESQVQYIVDAIRQMREQGIARCEVRQSVQDAFVREVNKRSRDTVWEKGGCSSYYTNAQGMNAGLFPNWSWVFRKRTQRWDKENYQLEQAG